MEDKTEENAKAEDEIKTGSIHEPNTEPLSAKAENNLNEYEANEMSSELISSTCTETSKDSSCSSLNEDAENSTEQQNISINQNLNKKPKGSTSSFDGKSCSSHKSAKSENSTLKERRRTVICRPRDFARNPITGEVTEVVSKYFKAKEKDSGMDADSSSIASTHTATDMDDSKSSIDYSHIRFVKNSKAHVRRNPITGEGIDTDKCPVHSQNFLRSGIRIKQPPGGISSGIF